MKSLVSSFLKKKRELHICIQRIRTANGMSTYRLNSFIITRLFGLRLIKDISYEEILIGDCGITIPDQIKEKVKNIIISYD